ncbi:MAG: hypothetical protein IQL11_02270 [Bacteroidales bacterium]|nr:hypothetical protein [Bacteroidales bacterium]
MTIFATFAVKQKPILILFWLIFLSELIIRPAYCQDESLSQIIMTIIEEFAADESDPEATAIFIEQLHELSENPVKINSGDEDEISRLFFLNDFQVKAIADYIKTTGELVSKYEIANIPGFDRQTAELILPFVFIEDNSVISLPSPVWRNTLLTNFIIRPGENDTSYLGSPAKVLSKYRFTAGHFSGGITAEKDQGERLLDGKPPLTDFISGYLSYTGSRFLKRIILGDFGACFGQGININTGIHTGLSLTAPGYMQGRNETKPYTSTDENNYLRGGAAEFTFRDLGISLFFSRSRIDATPGIREDTSDFTVTGFYKTGLHNTSSLLMKKDIVTETSMGANVTYDFGFLRAGVLWSAGSFVPPVSLQSGNPEDLFDFSGKTCNIYSFYYNSQFRKVLSYGEISFNNLRNLAMAQGITAKLSDRLAVNFLYRYYAPGFHTFHGRGPGSGSNTCNEKAMLGNFTFEAAKHLFVSAGAEIRNFPWLRYRISCPSMARKYEIRMKYIPSENLTFDCSFTSRFSMLDSNESQGINGLSGTSDRLFRFSAKYSPGENLVLSSAVNYMISGHDDSRGMLMRQDIVYRLRQAPLTLWIRYCIFNTGSWYTRLYTYENDLLYSYNVPALSGDGCRSYAMVKWEIGDMADLRVKYGITTLAHENDLMENRDEIRVQLIVRF